MDYVENKEKAKQVAQELIERKVMHTEMQTVTPDFGHQQPLGQPQESYYPQQHQFQQQPSGPQYEPFGSQYQPPSVQQEPPSQQYQPPSQQYQPPSQQYQPPSQQYQPPSQQYQPPSQQYQPPSQQQYYPPSPTHFQTEPSIPPMTSPNIQGTQIDDIHSQPSGQPESVIQNVGVNEKGNLIPPIGETKSTFEHTFNIDDSEDIKDPSKNINDWFSSKIEEEEF